MSDDMKATVKIGAEVEGLKKGLSEAQNAMKTASTQMSGAFAGLQGAFSRFNVSLLAVGATLATGGFFNNAVDGVVKLELEVNKLARQMGISASEALGMRYAIGDLYIDTDVFNGAVGKLTMGMQDGGEKFAKMGINIRDAGGNLKPMKEIMLEVNKKISEMEVGANRNGAAAYFYGKQWQEVTPILKLTQDAMDAGAKKAEELGIALSPDSVTKYRAAVNDAEDATEAFQLKIGQSLLPSITALITYFANNAMPIINGIVFAFKGLVAVVDSLFFGFHKLYLQSKMVLEGILANSSLLSKSLVALASDGVDSAVETWKKGNIDIAESRKQSLKDIEDADKAYADRMEKLYSEKKDSTPAPKDEATGKFIAPSSGATTNTAKDIADSAMKEYEKSFSQFKENLRATNGAFYEISKQDERDYWMTALADVNGRGKEYVNARLEIEKKVIELQHEARKEDLNNQIDSLKFKVALDSDNAKLKADVYTDIFNKIASLYDKDTKEYREALLNKMAADKEYEQKKIQIETETAQKIADLKSIYVDSAQDDLEANLQMGIITEEEKLQSIKELEEQRYQIKADTLAKELELNRMDLEKTRQLNDQKELIDADYAARKKSIDNQIRVASSAQWVAMSRSMEGPLSTAFQSMTNGTLKFSNFVKGIIPAIGQAFIKVVSDMAAEWLIQNTIMTAISAVFKAKEVAIHNSAEAEKTSAEGAFSLARVGIAMGEMFAKLTAFYAFLGPAAPVAAGATVAAVGAMAFGMVNKAMKSASGGYDIPTGVNPVTQLHQEEMVLPAHIANPLRETLASGGSVGGGTNITINAIDAKGVKALFMEHGSSLVTALKAQNRAFGG